MATDCEKSDLLEARSEPESRNKSDDCWLETWRDEKSEDDRFVRRNEETSEREEESGEGNIIRHAERRSRLTEGIHETRVKWRLYEQYR